MTLQVIDTTSPVINGYYSQLTAEGNKLVGKIDAVLQERGGDYSPSQMGRLIKADSVATYAVLSWMDRNQMFVQGFGNGTRRRYRAR